MNAEAWRIEATKDGKTSFLPRTFDSHAAAVRHGHCQMIYADFDRLVIVPPADRALEPRSEFSRYVLSKESSHARQPRTN